MNVSEVARWVALHRARVARVCAVCGVGFTGYANALYCSDACRFKAYRARKRAVAPDARANEGRGKGQ